MVQRVGEFVASGDAEFLISPLEVTFHGPDRQVQVTGDLLVRAARGGLHGRVQLTRREPRPGADGPDGRGGRPLAAGQQTRCFLLGGGCRFAFFANQPSLSEAETWDSSVPTFGDTGSSSRLLWNEHPCPLPLALISVAGSICAKTHIYEIVSI